VHPIKALRADGMPIGELSRLCSVNIETIRYYEKIKMLPAPLRTEAGHRVYGPKETRILVFIRRGRELGFTLDQIRALLNLSGPGRASCAEVREIAKHHIEDISGPFTQRYVMRHRSPQNLGSPPGARSCQLRRPPANLWWPSEGPDEHHWSKATSGRNSISQIRC
jgi:MerR family mercuric resistance operon transcriptional regulator